MAGFGLRIDVPFVIIKVHLHAKGIVFKEGEHDREGLARGNIDCLGELGCLAACRCGGDARCACERATCWVAGVFQPGVDGYVIVGRAIVVGGKAHGLDHQSRSRGVGVYVCGAGAAIGPEFICPAAAVCIGGVEAIIGAVVLEVVGKGVCRLHVKGKNLEVFCAVVDAVVGNVEEAAVIGVIAPAVLENPSAVAAGRRELKGSSIALAPDGVREVFFGVVVVPAHDCDRMVELGVAVVAIIRAAFLIRLARGRVNLVQVEIGVFPRDGGGNRAVGKDEILDGGHVGFAYINAFLQGKAVVIGQARVVGQLGGSVCPASGRADVFGGVLKRGFLFGTKARVGCQMLHRKYLVAAGGCPVLAAGKRALVVGRVA